MAKEDTNAGGLFSKVVRFVKNPATNWGDLDEASTDRDASLSKQALKEMIERKRRNDFVRKREFDMLRKLRRREATGAGPADAAARPSFFQSSMPSRPDDRAMTLKKIDEIEAQMSMQWWKTKHGNAASSVVPPGSDFQLSDGRTTNFPSSPAAQSVAASNNLAYARTAPDQLAGAMARSTGRVIGGEGAAAGDAAAMVRAHAATAPAVMPGEYDAAAKALQTSPTANAPELVQAPPPTAPVVSPMSSSAPGAASPFASTAPVPDLGQPLAFSAAVPSSASTAAPASTAKPAIPSASAAQKAPLLGGLAASYDASGAASGFSASKLFALEVDEVQHDPELEEAAIRFANGDDAGAEAGLIEAISPRGPRHQHDETWLTLFDLYRATSQYDRFESLAIDFASKFNRSSPMWFSIPEMVGKMSGREPAAETAASRKADWRSPANLGIQSVAALNAALAKASMPWSLDWGSLQTIDEAALPGLTKLFLSWAMQPVQLRFSNGSRLDDVLRQGAPSGVRTVPQDRWNLLLAYMRISHRPDEFELAALDFCVTYEVSPPSWEAARCEFKLLDAEGNTKAGQTIIGDAVHDSVTSQLTDVSGTSSQMTAQLATVELSGQIMGEPKPVLDKLEARLTGADVMIISCAKLIRVDFSAAGSLLNWVSARQAEGRMVQFTEVHRLVAAFFHVIGISEHAKVTSRVD
jgi:ABC-type transporter Mla MlaB component